MALFTGKGDKGTSKLFSSKPGERLSKSDPVFALLGELDELNSWLGVCKVKSGSVRVLEDSFSDVLHRIQEDLFIVQAQVAGAEKKLRDGTISEIEAFINAVEKQLPPITSFFIPGATELGALLDYGRTLARQVERRAVSLQEQGKLPLEALTMAYLNRLSSLLYALARFSSQAGGGKEPSPNY